MKKAIYLKVNRLDEWAIDNLHVWMKISLAFGYDTFIICDNEQLKKKIEVMEFSYRVTLLESIKTDDIKKIVERITIPKWNNAAYAHLTTFWHSRGTYDWFWNIDADDTLFCLPIDRTVYALKRVEEYAINNKMDCFSLDMWYSKLQGKDWSFGITFTNGRLDWEKLINKNIINYQTDYNSRINIDNFFYYLRCNDEAKIETWYCENLRFVHYSTDMIRRLFQSGIYHWKQGTLYSPLSSALGDMREVSEFPIANDVIKFDISITNEETRRFMMYNLKDGHARACFPYVSWADIESYSAVLHRQQLFNLKHFGCEEIEYILFGAGWFFEQNLDCINKYNKLRLVVDNNPEKQNRMHKGLKCISISDINIHSIFSVIIMLADERSIKDVSEQLKNAGIKCASYKEWKDAVFSDDLFG